MARSGDSVLVMRRVLALLTVAALAAGLTACGDPDLTRKTFPRTQVPAGDDGGGSGGGGGGGTTENPPPEPSGITAETLRLIDPCSLLDTERLATYGTPDTNVEQDYDTCRNYMETGGGESLSFTLRVGESVTSSTRDEATSELAGFRAAQSTVEGACFITIVIEDPEPDLAVEVQVGLQTGDACEPARNAAEGAAERLRSGATVREPEPGSLVPVDPCEISAAPAQKIIPGASDPSPYGLHQCTYGVGGTEIEVEFSHRYDPGADESDRGEPVDLGNGVTAFRSTRNDAFPVCELEWQHRKIGDDGRGDVVSLEMRDIDEQQVDVCGLLDAFAKDLVAALPKA